MDKKFTTMTKITEIDYDSELEYIKDFAKRMLRTQIFTGTYTEQRFVESLDSYRDIIKIEKHEKEFIENLIAVKRRIQDSCVQPDWIGLTEPNTVGAPVGYNIWTELPTNVQIFGTYWYKVKSVEFLGNEVRLKLDVIRSMNSTPPTKNSANDTGTEEDSLDLYASVQKIPHILKQHLLGFYKTVLTWNNIKDSTKYLLLLSIALGSAAIAVVQYLLEFFLKLIHESTGLVTAVSPVILTLINVIGKSIHAFFMMIATMWKSSTTKPAATYYNYYIDADNVQTRLNDRNLPPPRRSMLM